MRQQNVYIIGCGGGGSWLAPSMVRMVANPVNLTLVDGDTLEKKNLDRQLYTADDIGKNKAAALADKFNCSALKEYYSAGRVQHTETDWVFGCVDNNPARAAILEACDMFQCRAIIAANERTSAEAYVYIPEWMGTELDPRTYYPTITTDHANDPQRIAIGCTGPVQDQTPQLVTANLMSAALAGHLFVAWQELLKMENPAALVPYLPYRLRANATMLETFRVIDARTNEMARTERDEPESAAVV